MIHIKARNVNDAFAEAKWKMKVNGVIQDTRNGKVMAVQVPVVTSYSIPTERMLWDPRRDANPFFHIMEGLWMLDGRNDVKTVSMFNSNIGQFSDDKSTFHGAYGRRWRDHFGLDQLLWVIEELKNTPNTRRAVLGMWDPRTDTMKVSEQGLDVPCNTTIFLRPQDGMLDMSISNRSNDIVWGCYGANAVHMSMLQEFIAQAVGLRVGIYHQFSNNWHMYERHFSLLDDVDEYPDPYVRAEEDLVPILQSGEGHTRFLYELSVFMQAVADQEPTLPILFDSIYLTNVARPLVRAWRFHKAGEKEEALEAADDIIDWAIREACTDWLQRRYQK